MTLHLITLLISIAAAVIAILVIVGDLWILPLWEKVFRWWKTRNLCLKDYPDIHDTAGFIKPSIDGLIDYSLVSQIKRTSWKRESEERNLLICRLSRKLKDNIEKRYFNKGMRNVYERAGRILLHQARLATYYSFDEETINLAKIASQMQKYRCLHCRDSGKTWGPYESGLHTEITCRCQKKTLAVF